MPRPTILVGMMALVSASFAPDFRPEASSHITRLRQDLLRSNTTPYDPLVAPTGRASSYSAAGTDVEMQVRFFKVQNVKASDGSMKLKVWLRLYWKDTRLSWDPSAYGGITYAHFDGSTESMGMAGREIWLPDITPYNGEHGVVQTMESSLAKVSYDGSVVCLGGSDQTQLPPAKPLPLMLIRSRLRSVVRQFYSRPGSLEVMCKFSGLSNFPFDNLTCQIEFGGWAFSGGQQGILLRDGGYAFSAQEATSGSSYQEYTIKNVSVVRINYEYPCCPSEPWPVLIYSVTMGRASNFYIYLLIIPGVLITCLSFVIFWAPTAQADALGYGISVIVVTVLSNVVLLEILPICGEVLWIDCFSTLNTCFCCISLLQSSLVIMIENQQGEHIVPTWLAVVGRKAGRAVHKAIKAAQQKRRIGEAIAGVAGVAGAVVRGSSAMEILSGESNVRESVAGVLFRKKGGSKGKLSGSGESPRMSPPMSHAGASDTGDGTAAALTAAAPGATAEGLQASDHEAGDVQAAGMAAEADAESLAKRLVYFEKLFFLLDQNNSLFVEISECSLLFSFAMLDYNAEERQAIFDAFDSQADGKLNRLEFCALCISKFGHMSTELLDLAVANMRLAQECALKRNRAYWQGVANTIESWARVMVPAAYFVSLVVLFNTSFADDYLTAGEAMFAGFGKVTFSDRGTVLTSISGLVMFVSIIGCVRVRVRAREGFSRP
jgi:hypothetical protein